MAIIRPPSPPPRSLRSVESIVRPVRTSERLAVELSLHMTIGPRKNLDGPRKRFLFGACRTLLWLVGREFKLQEALLSAPPCRLSDSTTWISDSFCCIYLRISLLLLVFSLFSLFLSLSFSPFSALLPPHSHPHLIWLIRHPISPLSSLIPSCILPSLRVQFLPFDLLHIFYFYCPHILALP